MKKRFERFEIDGDVISGVIVLNLYEDTTNTPNVEIHIDSNEYGPYTTCTINLNCYYPMVPGTVVMRSDNFEHYKNLLVSCGIIDDSAATEVVPYGPFNSYGYRCRLTNDALQAATDMMNA